MPKKGFVKNLLAVIKRFFRARNVIVVSAHKIDHIPLSGGLQVMIALSVVACISVFSYFAGGYVAALSQVADKERKLHATEEAKSLMDKDFALLKRDLTKVRANGKELSEYSKFILDQYTTEKKAKNTGQTTVTDNKIIDRIQYLEKRINAITSENANLMYAIRERTEGKIDLFQDIISTTGLNLSHLDHALTIATPKPTRISSVPAKQGGGEGGPFIPYDATAFSQDNRKLLGDIERLVRLNKIVNTLPIGVPIAGYQERSGFGRRLDPFNHGLAFHPGLDMAAPFGAKVYASNDGIITSAGPDGSYGNKVDISHGLGLSTRYAHLSKVLVQEGDRVKKGQPVGLEGSTGRSTGPHLHYEVRYYDHPLDPKKFLNARNLYVSKIQ